MVNAHVLIKMTIEELLMEFFMSAEREAGVAEGERSARKKIEPLMIELLSDIELESAFKSWSFIPVIMSGRFVFEFPEFIKTRRKEKGLDCRLHIDFEEFKEADERKQIVMMLNTMVRSIDMMAKHKVTKNDQEGLKGVVNEVRKKLLSSDK